MKKLVLLCAFAVAAFGQSITGVPSSNGGGGSSSGGTQAVNSSITTSSLAGQAICALHTDANCFNAATDATAANCPAGTLTATCTFPTSITIPANSLGGFMASLTFTVGTLGTATIPNALIEIYLDSVRILAGTAAPVGSGSKSWAVVCALGAANSSSTAPLFAACNANGGFNTAQITSGNIVDTNTAPAVAIDTTVSHVLKLSVSYSANTTGNSTWLYGMRFQQ